MKNVTQLQPVVPASDVVAAIESEVRHHCYGNPTKRAALRLAKTLTNQGVSAQAGVLVLLDIERIAKRFARSGNLPHTLREKLWRIGTTAEIR